MSSHGPSAVSQSAYSFNVSVYHAASAASLTRVAFHPLRGDLVAVGSEQGVDVLFVQRDSSVRPTWRAYRLATWHVDGHVTAIDCSPRSDFKHLELVVATTAPSLLRLRWSEAGGYGKTATMGVGMVTSLIHEIKYARVGGDQAARTVATVGDQGVLLLWNIHAEQPELTKVIPHPFPLRTLSFHPTNPSLAMTGDARGMLRLIDIDEGKSRLSLFEPRSLARSIRGDLVSLDWNGAAGMPGSPTSRVGALIDGRWALWDLNKTEGGGPIAFGSAFSEQLAGRAVFRWNPADPKIFAVLCSHPNAPPALTLHNTSFPQAPRPIDIAPRPLQAHDMCWSPSEEVLAVVVDRDLLFVSTKE